MHYNIPAELVVVCDGGVGGEAEEEEEESRVKSEL